MRALLEESGLPAPDAIEYEEGSVWLFWEEQRVAVEIDLELDQPGADQAGADGVSGPRPPRNEATNSGLAASSDGAPSMRSCPPPST